MNRTSPFRSRFSAFTVTELLLSMLLLAVLMLLAFAVEKRVGESSRAMRCVNNLRQIGVLYHAYVGENNGRSRLFISGNQGMGTYGWYPILQKKGNLSDEGAQKAFGCPSLDWKDTRNWNCYGFRAGGPPGYSELIGDEDGRLYIINVAAVAEPSKALLAADTAANAALKLQAFRFSFAKAPEAKIHLRHAGRANGLFLDGHVRQLDIGDLRDAAISDVYDKEGNVVQTGL